MLCLVESEGCAWESGSVAPIEQLLKPAVKGRLTKTGGRPLRHPIFKE